MNSQAGAAVFAAAPIDATEQIKKLGELRDQGLLIYLNLTEQEFESIKQELADKDAAISELQRQIDEHTNRDTAIKGLQQELDTVRMQVKTLDEKVAIYSGLNNDLKADKEQLQKQLELVTLRLPPPRVGFWARLFGSKKE